MRTCQTRQLPDQTNTINIYFMWEAFLQFGFSPKVFSIYAASSADALGTIPGSLNAVRSNVDITKINNQAATNGTAGETLSNKYGQLKKRRKRNVNICIQFINKNNNSPCYIHIRCAVLTITSMYAEITHPDKQVFMTIYKFTKSSNRLGRECFGSTHKLWDTTLFSYSMNLAKTHVEQLIGLKSECVYFSHLFLNTIIQYLSWKFVFSIIFGTYQESTQLDFVLFYSCKKKQKKNKHKLLNIYSLKIIVISDTKNTTVAYWLPK